MPCPPNCRRRHGTPTVKRQVRGKGVETRQGETGGREGDKLPDSGEELELARLARLAVFPPPLSPLCLFFFPTPPPPSGHKRCNALIGPCKGLGQCEQAALAQKTSHRRKCSCSLVPRPSRGSFEAAICRERPNGRSVTAACS